MKIHLPRGALGLLLLTSLVGTTAHAEESAPTVAEGKLPLDAGVSIWTRYELRDGYDELGRSRARFLEGDFFVYRARLSLVSKPLAIGNSGFSTKVVFTPQASGFWGNLQGTVATPTLGIYEGYLSLIGPELRLDVGHFAMNYGDAVVIGDLRWHQTARSFDGARLRVGSGNTWVDGFFTVLGDGLSNGNLSVLGGDFLFAGAYGSLGGLISGATVLEPYLLSQIWVADDASGRPAVQMTAGARFLQKLGIIDLRAEAGLQFGRRRLSSGDNPEVFAYHADLEVGFVAAPGLRLSAEVLFASGDDRTSDNLESWDELFPTTHKFLGLMDIIGIRSNIASGVIHAKYGTGPFLFKFDLHGFVRPETFEGQSSFAGVEGDLNVIFKLTKGMTVRGLYALFIPGSDHFVSFEGTPGASDRIAHYVEIQYGLQL
ncbi:MAG: hypothetical protein AAFZ18_11575 [Myxococcota bacterium]